VSACYANDWESTLVAVACIKVTQADLGHRQDAQWSSKVCADQDLEPRALGNHHLKAVFEYSGFLFGAITEHKQDRVYQLAYLAQRTIRHAYMLVQVTDTQASSFCILMINL
jgi:hypothetical protein